MTEKAPDATTLSVNRKRRFRDNDIAERIFDEILRQAIEKGLVSGKVLYTDSTHVKAQANKHKKRLGWARSPSSGMTTIRRPRRSARFSRAEPTRTAASCTRKASRTASTTASTGRWTAAAM